MRRTISLGGKWRFRVDSLDMGVRERWFSAPFDDSRWWRVPVPEALDSYHQDLRGYDGPAWFRRPFRLSGPAPRIALLRFDGAGHTASVWLNGQRIGEHEGSYCPFAFRVERALRRGTNLLSIRIRNVLTPSSLPKLRSDWWKFAGITRPVRLVASADPLVWRATALVHERGGRVMVTVPGRILNAGGAVQARVKASVRPVSGGKALARAQFRQLKLGPRRETGFSLEIPADDLPRWEPRRPRLLNLSVVLRGRDGRALDRVDLRFGVRTLYWKGGKLLLNGKPVWLRGVNRMDEHPDWTCAFTRKNLSPLLNDIQKGLHGNFLRASHYPHHPLVPGMLDERGMMMLAEIPEYQNEEEPHSTPEGKRMLEELFWRDAHHPCVVIWSVGNEREPQKPAIARGILRLIRHMKSLDSSRPVSCVSNTFPNDPTLPECDVLCLNEYFGFWRGTPALTTAGLGRTGRELSAALDDMHRRLPRKPIVVTEFGVQAFPFHDELYGSEDWQARQMETHIRAFMARPYVQGCAVWSHQDTRLAGNQGYPTYQLGTRLLENFGLLTLDGRRRPSWFAVSRLYRKISGRD